MFPNLKRKCEKNTHVLEIWNCLDKNAYLHPDLLEKQDESTKALLSSGTVIDSASSERTRSRFKPGFFFTGFWTSPTNGFGGFLSLEKNP